MNAQTQAVVREEQPRTPPAGGDKHTSELDAAITAYQAALDALPAQHTPDSLLTVMRVIIARDQLAHMLTHAGNMSVEELSRLTTLDARLKSSATHLDLLAGQGTFAGWRDTYQPPSSAWWWKLDETAATIDANAYPLLQLVSSLLIVVTSVSLTIEIARRFLSSGIQFISVFTAVSTFLLTLLGGTAFTQVGRRGLEHLLSRLHLRRRYLPAAKIGLALVLLGLIFGINRLMPLFAIYFNNRAQDMQDTQQYAGAIDNYLLAINLNPNYPDPYYNLATTYEDVLDYAKAIDAYQRIEAVAPLGYYNLARAYNNLARLYILQRNDYAGALKLLSTVAQLNPSEPDVQYALHKNRGWSLYKLALNQLAESDLRQAMKIDNLRPSAHCLLAQVLEGNGDAAGALNEWSDCIAYATPDRADEVEAVWLSTASYRLNQKEGK